MVTPLTRLLLGREKSRAHRREMADGERNYSKDEIYETYRNYVQEADAFNSYLREVVAHTSRY